MPINETVNNITGLDAAAAVDPEIHRVVRVFAPNELRLSDRLRLDDRGADPAAAAGAGLVYGKLVAGAVQLFYRDDAGTVHQVTPLPSAPAGTQRLINSGSSTVAQNTTSDVVTFTRNASERVKALGFCTNNVNNVEYAEGALTIGLLGTGDALIYGHRRTVNANETKLTIRNANNAVGPSRTIDWVNIGIVP